MSKLLQWVEDRWVQCLVVFILVVGIGVWAGAFAHWMNLPSCVTVAEYGPGRNANEGSTTHERYKGDWRECRVPKYLP